MLANSFKSANEFPITNSDGALPQRIHFLSPAFAVLMALVFFSSSTAVSATCLENVVCQAGNSKMGTIIVSPQASDPTCSGPNDTIDVSLTIPIKGQSKVYDLTVIVALDGGDVIGGNNCAIENKALPHGSSPIEGTCGDKAIGDQTWITETYTIKCADNNNDGFLELDVAFARYNNKKDFDDLSSCNVGNLASQTKSQCDSRINVKSGIAVPPSSGGKVADVSIAKSFPSGSQFIPGTSGTYQLIVSNAGPDDVVGLSVTDQLPNGITLNANWTCLADTGSVCPANGDGGPNDDLISTTIDLQAGGQAVFTIPVDFSAHAVDY